MGKEKRANYLSHTVDYILNGKGREFVLRFAPKYSILKSSSNPRDLEPKEPWIAGRGGG